MNKILVTGLAILLASCALPPQNSTADKISLSGKWHCQLDYTDLNIQSQDHFVFFENGEMSNDNLITSPTSKYRIQSKGHWLLEEAQLQLTLSEKMIHKETQDTAQQNHLDNLFHLINPPLPETFSLMISELTPHHFQIKQEIEDKTYTGHCHSLSYQK